MTESGMAMTAGLVAPERVFVFENHDEAYYIWREHAVQNRIVVHIDAHHDMYGQWTLDKKTNARPRISIANYIYPAVEEGMLREVIWVPPERSLCSLAGRSKLEAMMRRISPDHPAAPPDQRAGKPQRGALVLGKLLRLCALDDLRGISEPVLLDIDVDYLTTSDIAEGDISQIGEPPWLYPAELVRRLMELGLKTDLVTIAYSVTGGYTPLQWKHLGDDLAAHISGNASADAPRAAEQMRRATEAVAQGDLTSAEAMYAQARQLWAESAAPIFHLAHLQLAMNREDAARETYREALERDSSYRTPFNNSGLTFYQAKRYDQAVWAFECMLRLDPQDANAHTGLGLVASRRKRWQAAEQHFREALRHDAKSVDAWRGLGRALIKLRNGAEAIKALEKSLTLTLGGGKSMLDTMIMKSSGASSFSDPFHAHIHARLGDLYAARGETRTAINAYRMGIAMGETSPSARLKLARLYIQRREWGKAADQMRGMFILLPGEIWNTLRWSWHKTVRGARNLRRVFVRRRKQPQAPSLWRAD